MPLAFNSAIGIEGLASLAVRTTHRSLVLQPSQVAHNPVSIECQASRNPSPDFAFPCLALMTFIHYFACTGFTDIAGGKSGQILGNTSYLIGFKHVKSLHRGVALHVQAGLDRQQSAPVFCPSWQLQPPAMAVSHSLLQSCQQHSALHPTHLARERHRPHIAITNGSAPQLGLDALCTSALECSGRDLKENAPPDLCMASGPRRGEGQLAGGTSGGGGAVRLGLGFLPSSSTGEGLTGSTTGGIGD